MELFQHHNLRNPAAITSLSRKIHGLSRRPVRLMEVCGGHTMAIHRFGLTSLLPEMVELVSGPGCPVCVSSQTYLDAAIWLCRQPDVVVVTYGDLIRVPASDSSLEQERSRGGDVRIVYSVAEAVDLARGLPERKIVFLGIGFETTAPSSAVAIRKALDLGLTNFFLLSAHKIMPPALRALVDDDLKIDGFLAPGHVSSITGTGIYDFLPAEYGKGVVVSGFEPLDVMQSVYELVKMYECGKPGVVNQYRRVVKPAGNLRAQRLLNEVFEPADDTWRGLGVIPGSGLQLREQYRPFDAGVRFELPDPGPSRPTGCICGEILKGIKRPADCPLFDSLCTPANPVGACMVSGEGSCAIVYKYNRR